MTPDKQEILEQADDKYPYDLGDATVTQRAALEAMEVFAEAAFNAAREFYPRGSAINTFYDIASELEYKTFQDYLQSKNKE